METRQGLSLTAGASLLLAACGGGSGESGAIGSTPPPPPPPVETIGSPQQSRSFATVGARSRVTFDLSQGEVIASETALATIEISYDASSKRYTVAHADGSQRFGPGDADSSPFPGESRYGVRSSGRADRLTLVPQPYNDPLPNQYVAMGYWERITRNGTSQQTDFSIFAYGTRTVDTLVPRDGGGRYDIDAFALLAAPGRQPRTITGAGQFLVDFQSGTFSTDALMYESSLTTDDQASGHLVLSGGGRLESGNGFAGTLTYEGINELLSGSLSGAFYGPRSEELGGAFAASADDGTQLTGALIGRRDSAAPPPTLSVAHVLADTTFEARMALFNLAIDSAEAIPFQDAVGRVDDRYWEPALVALGADGSLSANLTDEQDSWTSLAPSAASPRQHFDSYAGEQPQTDFAVGGDVRFHLYRIGSANQQLALTYTGFGIWEQTYVNGSYSGAATNFLLFGTPTPEHFLTTRRGTGTYSGVVHGITATAGGEKQDVGGASRFNIDFGAQSFSGALELTALSSDNKSSHLGRWTFADQLVDGQMVMTSLSPEGDGAVIGRAYHSIDPRFYGPNGEEIGATFSIINGRAGERGTLSITGVTVAVPD